MENSNKNAVSSTLRMDVDVNPVYLDVTAVYRNGAIDELRNEGQSICSYQRFTVQFVAGATPAPVLPQAPAVAPGGCSICGDGMQVGNPAATIYLGTEGALECGVLEGEIGNFQVPPQVPAPTGLVTTVPTLQQPLSSNMPSDPPTSAFVLGSDIPSSIPTRAMVETLAWAVPTIFITPVSATVPAPILAPPLNDEDYVAAAASSSKAADMPNGVTRRSRSTTSKSMSHPVAVKPH